MAVNITEIGNVYTSLLTKMLTKYDDMWSNNEIDAETYAKLVAQASTQLVQLSADLVQKQEQLDKDIDIKERNMVLQESELADKLLTAAKQRVLLDEEKETADKQQLQLDLQNDIETYKKTVLLVDEHGINAKKIDSFTKDIDIKERQMLEAEATGSKQRLSIDKDNLLKDDELDINTKKKAQLDADTAEKLDSTVRANTQLNDQLLSTAKDRDVKERNIVIQENELSDKLLTSAKQRILLDEEKETADKNQALLDVQKDIETYKKDTLLLDEHSINIKKVDSIVKDIDVKERSTVVQETELSDKLLTTTKQRLSIDKDNLLKDDELDINIKKKAQLDADTAERLDSTTRANTQLTDQLLSTAKDRDVKEREAVVKESELADKLLTTAEQRKLLVEQEKEAYTNRIIKDKEAVKGGLDKLNKTISNSPEDIYTPKYKTI